MRRSNRNVKKLFQKVSNSSLFYSVYLLSGLNFCHRSIIAYEGQVVSIPGNHNEKFLIFKNNLLFLCTLTLWQVQHQVYTWTQQLLKRHSLLHCLHNVYRTASVLSPQNWNGRHITQTTSKKLLWKVIDVVLGFFIKSSAAILSQLAHDAMASQSSLQYCW